MHQNQQQIQNVQNIAFQLSLLSLRSANFSEKPSRWVGRTENLELPRISFFELRSDVCLSLVFLTIQCSPLTANIPTSVSEEGGNGKVTGAQTESQCRFHGVILRILDATAAKKSADFRGRQLLSIDTSVKGVTLARVTGSYLDRRGERMPLCLKVTAQWMSQTSPLTVQSSELPSPKYN